MNNNKKAKMNLKFLGETMSRKELQKLMNRMYTDERMTTVTQVATDGVTEILLEQVIAHKERQEPLGPMSCLTSEAEEEQTAYKNNQSLYDKWKELLNEGEEGCGVKTILI